MCQYIHSSTNRTLHQNKWVINLSTTPLTSAQEALLARGPNFTIVPKYPPRNLVLVIEEAGTRLSPREAEECRAESSQLLRKICTPLQPNLTLEEQRAIQELKEDHSWVVLTVDKGVAMVVMDREDYTDKALSLLAGTNTCNTIPKDPTTKLKKNFPNTQGH